ncbi:histidine phosphatase family protein, partial [Shewanella sp. NIFS-20-20]|uniref:histidine phosphatase family protein n=1 Tax=Shewanella sp. NIFS-20-20 TaxID=2853806 RepID=UPI001C44D4DF
PTVRLILIRHGECEGGAIFRGHCDVAPTELGQQQLQQSLTQAHQRGGGPWQIMSSDLSRCRQGVLAYCQQHWPDETTPSIEFTQQLRELDYGQWDGESMATVFHQMPELVGGFFRNPWQQSPPGGESMVAFAARIDDVWQQLLSKVLAGFASCQLESIDGPSVNLPCVWLVTHGGVMRYLIAKALGLGQHAGVYAQLQLDYGAQVDIHACFDQGQWHLRLQWPSML